MRLYLAFLAGLLAGCTKEYGPQRLDFVNTTRFTSSNRTGLGVADTLASRVYAENTDDKGPNLGRMVVTVRYLPKRAPFLYPTPASSLNRDLIDNNPEDFVFMDSTFLPDPSTGAYPSAYLFTTTYGVRTTTGAERWTYDLYNTSNDKTASRAVQLSMRRTDSLNTYHDYTLKLVVPAVGVPSDVRLKSTRRFLSLLSGLALPAYTVLKSGAPGDAQAAAQQLVDLVVLPDSRTLVVPDLFTTNTTMWPSANRRATLIYLAAGQTANTFASQVTDTGIRKIYTDAAANATGTGRTTGPVSVGEVYAFRTNEGTTASPSYRYGLLLVTVIPTTSATMVTAGLQLQVRMAKL